MKNHSRRWEGFLGRPSIAVDSDAIRSALQGKRVLVTGAGGSVGSALARECSRLPVESLMLLDISEQCIFDLDFDLDREATETYRQSIIGDVCDPALLEEIFSVYEPEIVFHAAACKHVPLMERNPFTAARTNSIGTSRVADVAVRHKVEQLILLSTDKAADPSSIMGATKRVAEHIVLANASSTQMKAVRLANVLGSSGSVVPIFEKQLAAGQTLTVTDPEASRYFVTMKEAVSLLLAAACESRASCIYIPVLDSPQRIEQLAGFLIAAAAPGKQTGISFTGLRPGEKLHESLIALGESIEANPGSPLVAVNSDAQSQAEVGSVIMQMEQAISDRNLGALLSTIHSLVPEYQPSDLLQQSAASAVEMK
ncbi:polysaccharide biosynthesis protein [Silvibacterium acidisoli]|uniref:polysaccharide biosynthesis protein n=1 Tax=Acidobacteriaceae bacterium ZG23-2 TaxID=2883246 RepID=UPI00406C9190